MKQNVPEQTAAKALAEILFLMIDIGDSGPCDRELADNLNDYVFSRETLNMDPVRKNLTRMRKEFYK